MEILGNWISHGGCYISYLPQGQGLDGKILMRYNLNTMEIDDFEQIFVDLFGDVCFDRFEKAGLPLDRLPTYISLLSHVRECLDEEKFGAWVTKFIELETPTDTKTRLNVVSLRKARSTEEISTLEE